VTDTARLQHLLDLHRWSEAEEVATGLLREDPDDAGLVGALAQARLAQDDLPGALEAGNRLVALAPDDEWGHRICALVLDRMGRHEEALAAASEAVRRAPNQWRTHQAYALTAIDVRGKLPEARQAAVRAVELAPNEPDTHFAVGVVAARQRDVATATAAYERTLALDPRHARALNNLTVLRGHRDLVAAARGFGSTLREEPDLTVGQENVTGLATVYVRRIYWAALAAYVVELVAAYDGVTPWTVGIAVLLVVGVAAYSVRLGRAVPLGVRRFALRQMRSEPYLIGHTLLTAAMLVLAVVIGVVPHAAAVGLVLLRPLALANVALVVWGAAKRRSGR
jgi:tetratricopeptide (TPR) repeat protein